MEEIYILNVLQYLLGYFEIYMCFEILRKVYKKENTKIKQCFEILICISLAVIEAINRSFRLYSILLIAVVIIVISITFSLIYKIKLRYTLLHTSLYCLSLELLDLFIIFTMGIVLHKEDLGIVIGRQNSISRILALFLGRALMFLISLAIVRYKELIDKNRIGSLVLILLSEIIGVIYFQSVYAGDSIPDLAKGYYMYFVIIILAIMFFAIYSIYRSALEESKIIKLRNRMLERNYEDVMMNNIITSEGAAKISMFAMLSGALLNMILDPIFINVLNMGVTGAAIASAIGQALSTVVFLSYILMKKSIFTFKIKDCCYSKENMKEILKIGVPTLVFQLLTSLSIILINNQANALSVTHTKEYVDSVIAGMGAVTRIVSMGSLMVFGFIKGFQPIAGYSYGAKNFKRLNESIKTSILWSTVFCALFGLILILFPATIISKFTAGDMELVRIGQASLRANGFSIMLFGFYTVYSSLFLALGKGLEGFILGACRQGICFVPIILLLPSLVGISGILYAQPIADLISAIITVFMAINLHKSLEKERLSYIKNVE